jgi:hypothetical protein
MSKQNHVWGAALALSAGLASSASASSVTVIQTGVSNYRIFDTSLDGGRTYHRTVGGALQWKRVGGDAPEPTGLFDTFCIELTQHIGYGKYTYDVVPLEAAPSPGGSGVGLGMQSEKADLLREFWASHRDDVIDADTSAAFQLAVWEIVYDDTRNPDGSLDLHASLDLKAGSFRVKPPINSQPYLATAQSWLWQLDGVGPMAHLSAMSNPRYQDQVFEAPFPAAIWSGTALLLSIAAIKVKRAVIPA